MSVEGVLMSKINCPYCGSVQIKAMANQPKKYPRPSDPISLQNWQRGFDCKKCGNDFVVTPPKPKKPAGFFTKLLGWLLLIVIGFIVYAAIFTPNKDASKKDKPVKEVTVKKESSTKDDDPSKQEFSKEAEEAAHAYIPQLDKNQPESIKGSDNQNDTLSIKTTVRESN